MKHLTRSSAFCLPALLALAFFAFSLLTPHTAFATSDYTVAFGMTEGDPGDGLEFGGGGTGDFLLPDQSYNPADYFIIPIISTLQIIVIQIPTSDFVDQSKIRPGFDRGKNRMLRCNTNRRSER